MAVLLVNSVQAHAKRISIVTYNKSNVEFDGGHVIAKALCVEVRDDGVGLITNQTKQVFDAAYTTKHQKYGTGLGLYIALRLANRGGGTLQVVEQGIGKKGVAFLLILPVEDKESGNE